MSGAIATIPKYQFFTALGVPLVGGTLSSFLAGTTTPVETFSDSALTSSNGTSITLNARGECTLWLDEDKTYKFVLKDALGNTLWTEDNVRGPLPVLSGSGGSAEIGFIQAGSGAVARTSQDKMRDLIAVTDFGAVGDGATDDTAAVTAWLTYLSHNGLAGFLQAGTYRCTAQITIVATTDFAIYGEGSDVSELAFEGGTVGLSITLPDRNDVGSGSTTISGFSINKNGGASTFGGTALYIGTPSAPGGNPSKTLYLNDISSATTKGTNAANTFLKGIHLYQVGQPQLSNLFLTGAIPQNNTTGHAGVTWEGSTGSRCVNAQVYRYQSAFLVTGATEGPTLTNCAGVAVQDGIRVEATGLEDPSNPGLNITACHFNFFRNGIYAVDRKQATITNCLFYVRNESTETDVWGIHLNASASVCGQWVIGNNIFANNSATSTNQRVLEIDTGSNFVLLGNYIAAVWLGPKIGTGVTQFEAVFNYHNANSTNQFTNNATDKTRVRHITGLAAGTPYSVYRTAATTLTTGTEAAVTLGVLDSGDGNASTSTGTRLVVPTSANRVVVRAGLSFTANATGRREVRIKKNGANAYGLPQQVVSASPTSTTNLSLSTAPVDVVPGDYFELTATQTSGGNLDTVAGNASWISIEVLS